jgi:hypothetical protein
VGYKGALEQIMFQSPHQSQEAYQKDKSIINLKKTISCNDNACQIQGGMNFLQSFQYPLPTKSTQNN